MIYSTVGCRYRDLLDVKSDFVENAATLAVVRQENSQDLLRHQLRVKVSVGMKVHATSLMQSCKTVSDSRIWIPVKKWKYFWGN